MAISKTFLARSLGSHCSWRNAMEAVDCEWRGARWRIDRVLLLVAVAL